MAQTIKLKRSSVAGNVPGSSDLSLGEIAVNTADGAVYIKKGNNDIVAVADNDILHIDTTNGRVGIGTTSPSQPLHVDASGGGVVRVTRLGNSASAYGQLEHDGTNTTLTSSAQLIFNSGGSERARIDSSGNIGIGTTSPSQKLHVNGTMLVNNEIQFVNDQMRIYRSTNDMKIRTGSTDRVTITSTGNVGIGATSPSEKLHIHSGGVYSTPISYAANADGWGLKLGASNNAGWDFAGIKLRVDSTGSPRMALMSTGSVETISIWGGKVGIGTNAPGHKLHVVGANNTTPFSIDVGAAASYNFKANSNSTYSTTFNMDADGLTIGHDSAFREVALQTAGTNRLVIAAAGAITFNSAYTFPTADGSANQVLQTDGSGNLTFAAVSGSSGVTVSNNVNNRVLTGDGTNANAEANLTFDGSILSTTGQITSASGGNEIVLGTDGNIEITRTTGFGYIDFKNSTSEDFDQRISATSTGHSFSGSISLADNGLAQFGAANDLRILHNGTNSVVSNYTGNLDFKNFADDTDIRFWSDDGSGSSAIYFRLDGSQATASQLITRWDDNSRIALGTTNDLQLYHDGSNSYIHDNGTGNLKVRTNSFNLMNAANSEVMINAEENGAVTLYYDNAAKLITKSDGVDITGELQSDSLEVGNGLGNTRSEITTNAVYTSYYNTETSPRIQLGRDIGISGGAGIALGGNSSYALIGTNNTSGSAMYFKAASAIATVTTNPGMVLNSSGNLTVTGAIQGASFSDGTISGITFIDEDSFSTNSATRVPTQQSIKAYVDAQVAGVVDSSPAALNTLNELAAALGDDASFSTTTSTSLGNRLRVDTASQGLTGTQQANAITNLGITATKAELNYVDGVTSNIQTQLDGKLSTSGTAANSQLLDSLDSTAFLRSNADDTMSEKLTFSQTGSTEFMETPGTVRWHSNANGQLILKGLSQLRFEDEQNWDYNSWAGLKFDSSADIMYIGGPAASQFTSNANPPSIDVDFVGLNSSGLKKDGNVVWHAGNDGASSGLDADLLDGQQGSYYAPASTALTTSTTFGGDVSGTYGAIVVADDSHNHVISNVDGLQTALDGKVGTTGNQTIAGNKTFTGTTTCNNLYVDNNTTNYIRLYTEAATSQIADTFSDTTTDKSYIYFAVGTGSNDPGFIMHETSNSETNEAVLHLVPSDDNETNDYVSIHGTNDPDCIRLHTSGLIETAGGYTLTLSSDSGTINLNDNTSVSGNITVTGTVDGRDVATDGTKLDTIDTNADVTPSWVPSSDPGYLTSSSTQSKYLRSDANDDFSGTLNYTPDTGTILSVDGQAILQRMTANGALTIGHDDAIIIAGGDTSGVLNTNITNANEQVYLGAEGGIVMYAFPNNDTTWSNRKSFSFDGANGLNMNSVFTVDINGNLSATTKSFDIEHPSKEGMRLRYGSLEGPENGVYVRGKSKEKVISLPDYWVDLVHEDSITVQLTAIGKGQDLYVEDIKDNKVYVNGENYFYYILAERKDVDRFEVEYEG